MDITIENLTYSYTGHNVLKSIGLTIASGETIGIIGASGGGKSTLLKLISGLYDVQDGRISLGGACTSPERRARVAMVMQSAMLFPSSIRENITCGHALEENRIRYALNAAQLADWIKTLTDGLDTCVGERNGKVSGGQAQRIAIARAIAKDAPVVLLDEPTSALDGETGEAVIEALTQLCAGKTVVHVSHRPETLSACDRIFRLEGGELHAL